MRSLPSTSRTRGAVALGAMVATGAFGLVAFAQQPSSADAVQPAATDPGTPEGRLSAAERAISNGHSLEGTLTTRIEAANGRNDIVMIDCLSPLSTQLEATLASADSRLRALRLLAQGGDDAAAEHEYTMVMVASQRITIIESDMNQCLGDADIAAGEDQVSVQVTIDLPDEDPAAPTTNIPVPPTAAPPPPLSPAF